METAIASKIISQQTICGEVLGTNKNREFPEIAKKVLMVPNKDDEHTEDNNIRKPDYLSKSSSKGRTEIKQTSTRLN